MKPNATAARLESATPPQTASLSGKVLAGWSSLFGLLYVVFHSPFIYRYDLFLGAEYGMFFLRAKRLLLGEFAIYQWGSDYAGLGPIELLTAGGSALFGASLPLACLVSLIFWAMGLSFLIAYVARYVNPRAALYCGAVLVIGLPYFVKYSIQPGTDYSMTPFFTGAFLWLTAEIARKGLQFGRCAVMALLMGWGWYAHKQVLPIWLAIGVTLFALPEGRKLLSGLVRSKMLWLCGGMFCVGYAPELLYKLGVIPNLYGGQKDVGRFFALASPELMARNWYMLLRCVLTYFDADPWSRQPNGVHYLNHMENWESFPLNALDTIGVIAAFIVISYVLKRAVQAYQQKDLALCLIAFLPFVLALTVIVAAESEGGYYNIRRYLLPAGILLQVWLGIQLAASVESRRWVIAGVLALVPVVSVVHQWQMLHLPDELADYKRTVQEIEAAGYKYGASWFSYSHTLTAISNERIVFGILDRKPESPYQKTVSVQETLVVVWPARQPPPFEFAQTLFFGGVRIRDDALKSLPERIPMFGYEYEQIEKPRYVGELGWAPYRRVSGSPAPLLGPGSSVDPKSH